MTSATDAPAAFVAANTRLRPVPHVPEIALWLADQAVPLWQKTEEELGEMGLPPPFWAFAWAGGQALARYVLDNPAQVAGRRVLDLGSGSGLVAVAAKLARAAAVLAADVDVFAAAAIRRNAAANRVTLDVTREDLLAKPALDGAADVVLAADIFYERDMASRATALLEHCHAAGTTVLIGDPGRSYLPRGKLVPICEYRIAVTSELEDAEVKHTKVWRFA